MAFTYNEEIFSLEARNIRKGLFNALSNLWLVLIASDS